MRRGKWSNSFEFDANVGYTNRTASMFMYGQTSMLGKKEDIDENDTEDVMNEFELAAINEKWKERQLNNGNAQQSTLADSNPDEADEKIQEQTDNLMEELQLDRMEQRSLKLQNSILLDRIRLQRLERRILCFESTELGILERAVGNTLDSLNEMDLESNPVTVVQR